MTLKFYNPKRTERNFTMYNYNNTINTTANINNKNNNKTEEIKMNEIKMASILNKLDKSGVKVGFGTQVPAQLAKGNKHYATGYMTGAIPTNMMNNMFVQGAVGGIGLIIEGEKETPELMELVSYLSRNPHEGASLVQFCKTCLLAGNIPVREVSNSTEKYFICTNGKVLIRTGEDFEVVYEGVVLPDLDTMSDRQILDVLEASVETYENLTEEEYEEEDDWDEEEEEDEYECDYEEDGQQNWIF